MNGYLSRIIQRTFDSEEASLQSAARPRDFEKDSFDPFEGKELSIEPSEEGNPVTQNFDHQDKDNTWGKNTVFHPPVQPIPLPENQSKQIDIFSKPKSKEKEEPIYTIISGNLPDSYFTAENRTKEAQDLVESKFPAAKPKNIQPMVNERQKNTTSSGKAKNIEPKKSNQPEERRIKPLQSERPEPVKKKEISTSPKLVIGRLTVEVVPAPSVQSTNRPAPIQKSSQVVKSNFNTKRLLLGIKQM